jgi:hypothetical protein
VISCSFIHVSGSIKYRRGGGLQRTRCVTGVISNLNLGKKKGTDLTVALNAARLFGEGATDTDESLILKTDDERCHKETGTQTRDRGER